MDKETRGFPAAVRRSGVLSPTVDLSSIHEMKAGHDTESPDTIINTYLPR